MVKFSEYMGIEQRLAPVLSFVNAELTEDNYLDALKKIFDRRNFNPFTLAFISIIEQFPPPNSRLSFGGAPPEFWLSSKEDHLFTEILGFEVEIDRSSPITYIHVAQQGLKAILNLLMNGRDGTAALYIQRILKKSEAGFSFEYEPDLGFESVAAGVKHRFTWVPSRPFPVDASLFMLLAEFLVEYADWQDYLGKCQHCGNFFVKYRKDQKYHDISCRNKARQQRYRERTQDRK